MADYITRSMRKKDLIEQFGFKKTNDGIYRMTLKGLFEDHPQDHLNFTLNLYRAHLNVWIFPQSEKVACYSTPSDMLEMDPDWLLDFFNHKVHQAIDDVHRYVYEDLSESDSLF